ncbi:olfactory receptor 14J1-like, partial [Zonotrichia leucophrys gambelii]|uniref:olfactory receptor 14J1-like n=1 Tax=Zonotrichia leucophrys gambelii TaxID=257770 RepID=UPI003140191E
MQAHVYGMIKDLIREERREMKEEWSKYKYGKAWQIDYITLPQTCQGKRYMLTTVEATTGCLETHPVPHTTVQNTILGLEKQILWRHAEYFLLTVMCYDRYVSICKPLHYGTLLGSRACAHMAAAAWACAFLNALLHTVNTFSLRLCHGNALGQFFCEVPQILKLSCSKSYVRELGLLAVSVCLAFGCFVFIVFSYVQIFRAVLRIRSERGRHKASSTCLPHLVVVSLFLSTSVFAHLKPPSISSPSLDLSVSVLYSVVSPTLNPLIYSLRNQKLKAAVSRL